MDFELLDQERPQTVQNFIRYVEAGRYQDMFIHRLLPGLIAELGGYRVDGRSSEALQFAAIPMNPGIANEAQQGGTSNGWGTLALGRISGRVEPLAGEFFLNLGNQLIPLLATNQGGYPVFARLVAGHEVLETINKFAPDSITNRLISMSDPALPPDLFGVAQFPVRTFSLNPRDQYENVLFVDITLLQVTVQYPTEGTAVIGWKSVEDRFQEVEYTEIFPPDWKRLTQQLGTGEFLSVIDPEYARQRFYRVRVLYESQTESND
jgi:cyclophilin family peptidyl-prolyl cis-trans isomerase